MDKLNKKNKVVSIGSYKDKAQKRVKKIKEFKEGPKPIPTCTCGQHTDSNQFLTEKQVTKHYLKDRKRYVKELKGEDPLKTYMKTFENLMSDKPLVKLNMETDLVSWKYIQNHFNKGMKFYKQYIEEEQNLTSRAKTTAKELRTGYKVYKEHIIKSLINSYIIAKLRFTGNNSDFAGEKDIAISVADSLTSPIRETEGYICFMEKHFHEADTELKMFIPTIASKNLDKQIDQILNDNHIPSSENCTLGIQIQESLDVIKQKISYNRQRDLGIIKERYDKVKDDCSLEYKAKTLIDLELRNREIAGHEYNDKSEFTTNNSTNQLTETIGMEDLIWKLSTKELKTLFEQFKSLEE